MRKTRREAAAEDGCREVGLGEFCGHDARPSRHPTFSFGHMAYAIDRAAGRTPAATEGVAAGCAARAAGGQTFGGRACEARGAGRVDVYGVVAGRGGDEGGRGGAAADD